MFDWIRVDFSAHIESTSNRYQHCVGIVYVDGPTPTIDVLVPFPGGEAPHQLSKGQGTYTCVAEIYRACYSWSDYRRLRFSKEGRYILRIVAGYAARGAVQATDYRDIYINVQPPPPTPTPPPPPTPTPPPPPPPPPPTPSPTPMPTDKTLYIALAILGAVTSFATAYTIS
ncbi:MAG: hypothetical protein ACO2PN_29240 [Pyrobaculum sp.]